MNKVQLKLTLGGGFIPSLIGKKKKRLLSWDGGWVFWRKNVKVSKIDVHFIRESAVHGFVSANVHVPSQFNCWYRQKGRTFTTGKRELVNSDEIKGLLETVNKEGVIEVFVTTGERIQATSLTPFPLVDGNALSAEERKKYKKEPYELKLKPNPLTSSPTLKNPIDQPMRRSPRLSTKGKDKVDVSASNPKRFSQTDKGKGKLVEEDEVREKNTVSRELFKDGEEDYNLSDLSDSEHSDPDVDWSEGEEEFYDDLDDDEWVRQNTELVNREVIGCFTEEKEDLQQHQVAARDEVHRHLRELDVNNQQEEEQDSDDLRSVHSDSDVEELSSQWFNGETDFSKPIELVQGLRFSNVYVLRKALRVHAIENRYDYYFLHNDSKRITIHCKRRCNCVYNKKSCRLPKCECRKSVICPFKVYAARLVKSETWQIKSLRLKHLCMRTKMNNKVTAEFLADRYLEEFRSNPNWRIKQIQQRALTDLGIKVGYFKAWLARCRAKLIIFGSAAEQYAKVWDYAKALVVHNPGTGVVVVVEGVNRPEPPLFLRMFVCLAPLRDGFVSGCRPIIGVDGCHLKGAYPGQVLVAVAKDGNNNIFPLAWATVEIENKDSWSWFLETLVESIGGQDEGEGLTFMSDRQKGLLEAFETVVPKAETRYCVRHIWSNFKQQFQGSLFKELFWNAARAYTQTDFEVAMESINFLSEEAYDYLAKIPPQHWSRHAMSPTCKSNMLLNNLCETFNAVIKDARDKPILTQMEWLRRYMMKRTNDKWMAASEWEGLCVPYVKKVFGGLEKYARTCIVQSGRDELYEVEYKEDTCVVNLEARSCTCYRWDLTGLPCVHAFAAMLDKRVDPELYVHPYYYRVTYLAAYETPIQPMPGAKHWDKVSMREPMPPAFKVQPGRPKAKKRKLEQGEGSSTANSEPNKVKRRNQCKNCGGFGHYAKTCALEPAPAPVQVQNSTPLGGRPSLHNPWMKEQRKKSELRAMKKSEALGATAGPNSIGNKKFPQEVAKAKAAQASSAAQPTSQVQHSAAEASASQPMTRSRTKLSETPNTSASQPLPRQHKERQKIPASRGLHQHQFMHHDM